MDKTALLKTIEGHYADAVRMRRFIHAHPELSGRERATAAFIAAQLRRLGLRPRFHLKRTAVSCRIQNGTGKTVALRADIDALPLLERTGLAFASRRPGIMHACGHDMHTAILLGVAAALVQLRAAWRGTVVLLFQPSEEMEPGGARGLIENGVFPRRARGVFGLHVNPELGAGVIGMRAGSDFAGVLNFSVTLRGRGGHAAAPHATANPIRCAAEAIERLSAFGARLRKRGALIAVGTMHAGSRSNIIPETAEFRGTVRFHDQGQSGDIKREIAAIIRTVAKKDGLRSTIGFAASYPPNWNDPAMTGALYEEFRSVLGFRKVLWRKEPVFYAEDFAYFQRKVPGVYVHLGVTPHGTKRPPGLHDARFAPDEQAMRSGMVAHIVFVMHHLGRP